MILSHVTQAAWKFHDISWPVKIKLLSWICAEILSSPFQMNFAHSSFTILWIKSSNFEESDMRFYVGCHLLVWCHKYSIKSFWKCPPLSFNIEKENNQWHTANQSCFSNAWEKERLEKNYVSPNISNVLNERYLTSVVILSIFMFHLSTLSPVKLRTEPITERVSV